MHGTPVNFVTAGIWASRICTQFHTFDARRAASLITSSLFSPADKNEVQNKRAEKCPTVIEFMIWGTRSTSVNVVTFCIINKT